MADNEAFPDGRVWSTCTKCGAAFHIGMIRDPCRSCGTDLAMQVACMDAKQNWRKLNMPFSEDP